MAHGSGTLHSGLWNGVRNTTEPFDDTPNLLQDANNIVIPDPQSGSGAFGRPAFRRFYPRGYVSELPPFGQTIDGVNYRTGQCITATVEGDNVGDSVFFCGGVMYTNVYPFFVTKLTDIAASVCIDVQSQIYVARLDNQLIVNDQVFQPWAYDLFNGTVTMIDAFPAVTTLRTSDAYVSAGHLYQATTVHVDEQMMELRTASGMPQRVLVPRTDLSLPAGTIPKNTWGAYRITYSIAGGWLVTAASGNATGYATEALAITGLNVTLPPHNVSSSTWHVGYMTVQADATHDFVAGTTALVTFGTAWQPDHCQAVNYYAGRAVPWQAQGNPVVYDGALFFIHKHGGPDDPYFINGFSYQQKSILWSEPNDPFTGYQQTNYDNAWTLSQTSTDYIYALAASNLALYYFRAFSIGAIQGAPGVDFRNTATNDSVSFNIGSTSPASICQFGQYLYFADIRGRTYRFSYGSAPEKIWLQARAVYEDLTLTSSYATANSKAFIDPNLNVYVVFPFADTSGLALAYDAMTGRYLGRWSIAGGSSSTSSVRADACGVMQSRGNTGVVGAILGSSDTTATAYGYLWGLLSLNATEVGWSDVPLWADSVAPSTTVGQVTSVKTNRLGYSTVNNYTLGQVRLVLDSNVASIPAAGVTSNITVTTPNGVYTDWAAVTAPDSYDGVNLATFLGSGQVTGRGIQVTAINAQTTAQWVCYRVEADVVAGTAYPGER